MAVQSLTAIALVLVLLGAVVPVHAEEPAKAKTEPKVVPLWTEKAPGAVGDEDRDRPTLTVHLPEASKATGTGMIVCPGGGYTIHVVDHEGQQVARWLNSIGVAAFVLKYRLKPRYQPADALIDGKRAIRYVRQHAEEFGISPKRLGIIGFSAGGHLAACTGIDFDEGDAKAADPVERQSSRPDFMVLVYGGAAVVGDPAKKDEQGKAFTAKAPPAFLFSTMATRQPTASSNATRLCESSVCRPRCTSSAATVRMAPASGRATRPSAPGPNNCTPGCARAAC